MVAGRLRWTIQRWTALDHGLMVRLLSGDAQRWRRRARFYERHRDYFPRLASGRFVARCRELEAMYRNLAIAVEKLAVRAGRAWRASIGSRRFAVGVPEDVLLPLPLSKPVLRTRRIRR
ncbi:hypothetical protein [Nitrospira sp. Nam80]